MTVQKDGHIEVTTEEARQGETSGHMRMVLGASLVMAVIAGVIIYFQYFSF